MLKNKERKWHLLPWGKNLFSYSELYQFPVAWANSKQIRKHPMSQAVLSDIKHPRSIPHVSTVFREHYMMFARFNMAWYSSGPQFLSSRKQRWTTHFCLSNIEWGAGGLVSPIPQRTSASPVCSCCSTAWQPPLCPLCPALKNRVKRKIS